MNSPVTVTNGDAAAKKGPHIFVFDNMRLRSHLFWRWISTHSALYTTYHRYLMAGFLGASSILPSLNDTEARSNENRAMLKAAACNETFETSNRMLESDIAEAEKQVIFFHRFELSRIGHTDVSQKKILFTNEHIICCLNHETQLDLLRNGDIAFPSFETPFPNPTVIPGYVLDEFTPIILIRHPVLQIESVYTSMLAYSQCRPGDENFDLITSFQYHRLVFEYFRLSRGTTPIVVDGEDVLWRTEGLSEKLGKAIGIDPAGFKDSWDQLPKDWWSSSPFVLAMTKTIHESTGIERVQQRPDAPDIHKAFRQWSEKYGQDVALKLKERVELAMPHYELLEQYKI